jgi:hypothetical protein
MSLNVPEIGGHDFRVAQHLRRRTVSYYVRDPYCLGRSCLDLGPDVKVSYDEKGLDKRLRTSSACRRMLNGVVRGSCRDTMEELASKRRADGVRLGRS